MFGALPVVNALESRKRLLVAESELNRAELLQEWRTLSGRVRAVAERAWSFASLASPAKSLLAGLAAFASDRSAPGSSKSSWFHKALAGARLASVIWLALRARSPRKKE